ncbi:hypothetical protein ACFLQR_04810, partial [Verrucomicrobiota bacterium]
MCTKFFRFIVVIIATGMFLGISVDFLSSQGIGLSLTTPAMAQEEEAEKEGDLETAEGAPTTFFDYWK